MKLSEARAKVILFKSKTLACGCHPVVLRITFKRQRRYYSLPNIKSSIGSWNSDLGRFSGTKSQNANKEINRWETKADNALQTIKNSSHDFTFDRFERTFFGSLKKIDVYNFIDGEIQQMKAEGRFSSMNVAKPLLSRLKEYHPKDLKFADMDYSFLRGFQSHLGKTCSTNGIAAYFRTLKALINKAMNLGYADPANNGFKSIRIKKESTRKRAISKEQMIAIINHPVDRATRSFHSKNYFVFSYLCRGINFMDMAMLKWNENIRDGRLVYVRSKTKKEGGTTLSIPIRGMVSEILDYYRPLTQNTDYIFPILKMGYTLLQQKQRVNDMLKKTNEDLKLLCSSDKFNIEMGSEITFYVARHTWATVQKKSGTATELIQEGLGHQNKIITETYLDSFENSDLDRMDEVILTIVKDAKEVVV